MAVLNIDRGFVYLARPRTASRATVAALLKLEGSIEVAPHHCGTQIIFEKYPEACACPIVFTAVRNPYDVLLSNYLGGGYSYGPWQEWLELRLSQDARLFRRFEGQFNEVAKYETL